MSNNEEQKHEWHLGSDFCIHCGLSRVHELDEPYPCHRHKNVTAISHRISIKRVKELIGNVLRTSHKDRNSNS